MLGKVMAKHLLELGHRKVAFITPPLTRRRGSAPEEWMVL